MKLTLNSFTAEVSYPAIAVLSLAILSNSFNGYVSCLIALIIHETGHLIAMALCKCFPNKIVITLFDIRIINPNRNNISLLADIFITVSGSVFNLLASLIFIYIYQNLAIVNILMCIFNLLPVKSLDGGQLLYLILSRFISLNATSMVIDILTIITALPLFFVGILVLFENIYNFSLLFLSIYLIATLFFKEDKYL